MKQSESETFLFNRMFLYSNWLRVSKNLALYRRTSVLRMAHHINASGLDISPPIHRVGANVVSFDRSKFRKSFPILSARVPASSTHNLLKDQDLKRFILDIPKIRNVDFVDEDNVDERLVLLRVQQKDELPSNIIELLDRNQATLADYNLELDYNYWTTDEILQAILPQELCDGSPTGFSVTGHLAHFNLKPEYLPYKNVIGQVALDKNSHLRTVVNKLDNIHNQFRFFDMELIAGEPDFLVTHSESNCLFTFDFREVYWNSRLHTEHDRLVQMFAPEKGIIADVFAGVGPFAVPAAKKGSAVLANDLNPDSAKWLRRNVRDNHVSSNVRAYCEDGRDFIRNIFRRASKEPFPPYTGRKPRKRRSKAECGRNRTRVSPGEPGGSRPTTPPGPARNYISHVVMNLPETAIEFLDAFRGVYRYEGTETNRDYPPMPMVHCYCFTRFLEPSGAEADIRSRVEDALGGKLKEDVSLHLVRSVAPNKDMYCISFRLPHQVACK